MKIRATVQGRFWQQLAMLLDGRVFLLLFFLCFLFAGVRQTTGFPFVVVIDNSLFRLGVNLQRHVIQDAPSYVRIDVPPEEMQRFMHDPASAVDMMAFLTQLQASTMKGAVLVLHDSLWTEYSLNDLLEHSGSLSGVVSSESLRAVAARMASYRSLMASDRVLRAKVITNRAQSSMPLSSIKNQDFFSVGESVSGIETPQMQQGLLVRPLLWNTGNGVRPDARLALFALLKNARNPEWQPELGIKIQGEILATSPRATVLPFLSIANGFTVPALLRHPLSVVTDQSALRLLQNKMVVIGEKDDLDADDLLLNVISLERAAYVVPFKRFAWLHLGLMLAILLLLFLLPLLPFRYGGLLVALFVLGILLAQQIVFQVHSQWFPVSQWLLFLLIGYVLVSLWCIKHAMQSGLAMVAPVAPVAVRAAAERKTPSVEHKKPSWLTRWGLLRSDKSRAATRIQPTIDGAGNGGADFDDSTLMAVAGTRQVPARGAAPLQAVNAAQTGLRQLGRYQIQREVGRGAMGVVYLAFDPTISRQVAIKTLHYHLFSAEELPDIRERFLREARAVGKLKHHNIVTIYDADETADLAYVVMDFVDGVALSAHTHKGQLLSVQQVYYIMAMAADAVYFAHSNGIVHRDIKPSNILFDEKTNDVKVADFGIARIMDGASTRTRTGDLLGSPLYMSPEQIRGEQVTFSTDIFSLGVTFYQLLTGELPFKADNLANLSYQIAQCKFRPVDEVRPDLPASAKRIINKALQKNPANRYASVAELERALLDAHAKDFS